ncbi:MAG TPA: cysteine synthase A [bacterium]|jgi:cysteine synthase A|nr:cysteine synthase A [bacterium]HQO92160.1 cysteine synthase A [bacterium]
MVERIFRSMLELVGSTPLVKLNSISRETGAEVIGKLEYFNPMSSVKDRIALAMIEDGEKRGVLNKNVAIVEPTSGNTGVGLAFVCAVKGYRLILTMPETMSIERRKLLKILGAELVLTPGEKGMKGAIEAAEKMAAENPGHIILQQFANPANPETHVRTTAVEILNDCDGHVDIFVAGVGTGGTITGVGKVLKEKNPDVLIIAVEPDDSPVLSGGTPGPHKLQGIGAGFVPAVLDKGVIDEVIRVTTDQAFSESRKIAREEGVFCGISSGAALSAARTVAARPENKGKRVVVIIPDTGERYLSTALFE